MKTALITTTIHTPTVLALYRKFGPDVEMFVAGDYKTPVEAVAFCESLGECNFYSPQDQKDLGYQSSELIGWNSDSRRNIALLEAVKSGADVIVSTDDDMLPMNECGMGFFFEIEHLFSRPYSGLCLGSAGSWFDAGFYTIPPVKQRGLPVDKALFGAVSPVLNAEIGAVQGIILGIPDTDAMSAITDGSRVYSATDVLLNGFVVDQECLAVLNSQLTAFRRELAPAFAQFYKWQGRNTDILASIIMRRLMHSLGLYTYFGPPMGFHARQPRPLLNDLKSEMFGLEHIVEFTEVVNGADLQADWTPVGKVRYIYGELKELPWFAPENYEAAMAFLADMEGVM